MIEGHFLFYGKMIQCLEWLCAPDIQPYINTISNYFFGDGDSERVSCPSVSGWSLFVSSIPFKDLLYFKHFSPLEGFFFHCIRQARLITYFWFDSRVAMESITNRFSVDHFSSGGDIKNMFEIHEEKLWYTNSECSAEVLCNSTTYINYIC